MDNSKQGSLVIVGTGICVVNQTTLSARSYIENADIVFAVVSGTVAEHWIGSLNDNVVALSGFYSEGKPRLETYQQMIDTIVDAVRAGQRVCAAFYGHPGVFVYPSHQAIQILRQEGYSATMEPGISAEDCLVADIGIDPGNTGCQALETSQFLFYQRPLDPLSLVILWQVGLAGDHAMYWMKPENSQLGLTVLTEALLEYYPPDHQVILYEAATMMLMPPRIEYMRLDQLADSTPSLISTLVIPAFGKMDYDPVILGKLGITEQQIQQSCQLAG